MLLGIFNNLDDTIEYHEGLDYDLAEIIQIGHGSHARIATYSKDGTWTVYQPYAQGDTNGTACKYG